MGTYAFSTTILLLFTLSRSICFFKLVSDRRERGIDISKLDEDQNNLVVSTKLKM